MELLIPWILHTLTGHTEYVKSVAHISNTKLIMSGAGGFD